MFLLIQSDFSAWTIPSYSMYSWTNNWSKTDTEAYDTILLFGYQTSYLLIHYKLLVTDF